MIVPNIQQIKIDIDKTYLRIEHLWTKWGNNSKLTTEEGHWFGAGRTLCQISQGFLCNSNPSWLLVKLWLLHREILLVNTKYQGRDLLRP